MNKTALIIVSTFIVACFAGCETDNSGSGARSAGSAASSFGRRGGGRTELLIPAAKINAIAQGMTADEVRQLLGKPNRVQSYAAAGKTGEIWTYNLSVTEVVKEVSTGVREIESINPMTNQPMTIREPIMTQKRSQHYSTLELLMIDNHLVERRPGRDVDVGFD